MHLELDTHRPATFAGSRPASDPEGAPPASARLAVDGRFLSRGDQTVQLRGVAYGPFSANSDGQPFPEWETVAADFAQMKAIGVNAVRVYHRPPPKFLDLLAEHNDLGVVIDIPWSKHLCFLQSTRARREARETAAAAARDCRHSPAVLAYSIGNEIPPDIVRWHGARRIERFLQELADAARQADPGRLVTYANYPPTEYLDLSFLDFATFNVYLHDLETFRRYLLRLMNLVGDKPLVLGEIGMDTLRHGEPAQAEFLAGHVREATAAGLSGSFVFTWTDEWFTGGHKIADWAFGVTRADRTPKISCNALAGAFTARAVDLLPEQPRVSVVVCSYNGGSTLDQCLESLCALDYPDYEVILVDDGSTDDTRAIAARFPQVRAIHQENRGLAAARNVGLQAATGQIVAYTDSDCMAHPDWLTHLAAQFDRCDAAAVGGPNLAPRPGHPLAGRGWPGRVATCVAAAPGQPMHVLESDQVAEHIPGCNMAFRRGALLAINGFDPQFRAAGDDVDICWRLQAAGYWISFAPAAMVWHHRRQTPRAYLRQQAGYGEAEALLRFKHPDRFNFRGQGKWTGMLYGASLQGLVLDHAIIYRGTFGTSPFQCIYQPGPSHWAMVPSTLEWHFAIVAFLLLGALWLPFGVFWWPMAALVGGMIGTSLIVALMQALQAKLPGCHEGRREGTLWVACGWRLLVAALCYVQPLVRGAARYRTRYFAFQAPTAPALEPPRTTARSWQRTCEAAYWGVDRPDRTQLVQRLIGYLDAHRCGKTIDTGWSESDLEVFRDVWTCVSVDTVQEEHGGGARVVRIRSVLHTSTLTKILLVVGATLVSLASLLNPPLAVGWSAFITVLLAWAWYRGAELHAKIIEVVDDIARDMALVRVHPESEARPVADRGQHAPAQEVAAPPAAQAAARPGTAP